MDEFKKALTEYLQDVCERFATVAILPREWVRVIPVAANDITFGMELRPNYRGLLLKTFGDTQTSTTFSSVMHALEHNPALSNALLRNQNVLNVMTLWNDFMDPFLFAYLERVGVMRFDQAVFDAFIRQLEDEVQASYVIVVQTNALTSVQMTLPSFTVDNGLVIRQITSDDVEGWINEWALPSVRGLSDTPNFLDPKCALEIHYRESLVEPHRGAFLEVEEKKNRLLTALQLVTERNVHVDFTTKKTASAFRRHGGLNQSGMWLNRLTYSTLLDLPELNNVKAIYHLLQTSLNVALLNLPIRRFVSASDRISDEDRLIDYWIALESLFGESGAEISFSISLRIAGFLRETVESRQQVYDEMRYSYSWRSALVHGNTWDQKVGRKLSKKSDLASTTAITRTYLHESIEKLLRMNQGFALNLLDVDLFSRKLKG